jgi:hypothetical protein
MSGFRRHLMGTIATQRQYIEGYCQPGTQTYYLHIIQFTDEANYDNTRYYSVTPDANGYWRWYVPQGKKIKSLVGVCSRYSQANSDALVSIDFSHIDPVIEFTYAFGIYQSTFFACTNLKSVNGMRIVNDNTLGSSCFTNCFYGCTKLEYVDVHGWKNTTKASHMNYCFRDCYSLTTLDGQDEWALRPQNAYMIFRNCQNIEEVDFSNFVGGNSTSDYLFANCQKLKRIKWGNLHFTSTSFSNEFYNCESLEAIDLSVFSGSTPAVFTNAFSNCSSLKEIDLTPLGTCSVSAMGNAFNQCNKLKKVIGLNKLDVTNCTSFSAMCSMSKYLEDFDIHTWQPTGPSVNFASSFRECYALKLNASTIWDVSGATASRCEYMYASDSLSNLQDWEAETGRTAWGDFTHLSVPNVPYDAINSGNYSTYHYGNDVISTCGNIEKSLNFAYGNLDLASAILILQHLQDVTSYGGQTLSFSTSTSALVRADTMAMNLVAQAQANGWTITFN